MYLYLVLTFVIYAFTNFDVTFSEKLDIRNLGSLGSSKLSDCRRCKVLSKSFNYWLEKTSRGKFEGGDAAWEEAKLTTYARSEIRLVEVQEGLCSEVTKHQDQCYSLAEDAEASLETWWFHEDPESVDLYTWLCIERLKYCCPQNHFGEACILCPLDMNNKVCSANGKCDGEGTRHGNGSCICSKGYAGQLCENCAKNYYLKSSTCEPCHISCDGCSGDGASACFACRPGWTRDSLTCKDVDECLNPMACKSNQYCINKEGSYSCKDCHKSCKTCNNKGHSHCTTCSQDSFLWEGSCIHNHIKHSIYRRLILYIGFLFVGIFVFRHSKYFAALLILIQAIYVYYVERTAEVRTSHLLWLLYK